MLNVTVKIVLFSPYFCHSRSVRPRVSHQFGREGLDVDLLGAGKTADAGVGGVVQRGLGDGGGGPGAVEPSLEGAVCGGGGEVGVGDGVVYAVAVAAAGDAGGGVAVDADRFAA
jgi:hypothetical protein